MPVLFWRCRGRRPRESLLSLLLNESPWLRPRIPFRIGWLAIEGRTREDLAAWFRFVGQSSLEEEPVTGFVGQVVERFGEDPIDGFESVDPLG